MAENKQKTCFVISPIGEETSDVRKRADKVLNYIIKPITEECGYQTMRADALGEPGMITKQVIEHILNDDLVIADLTSQNPNVFYELAVRHVIRKPTVQIIAYNERIPFDVSPLRTIRFDIQDIESVENCKEEIRKQIKTVEKDPGRVDNPITITIDLQALSRSGRPQDEINAEIINMLQDVKSMFGRYYEERSTLQSGTAWTTIPPSAIGWTTTPPSAIGWTTPSSAIGWTTIPSGTAWTTTPSGIGWMPKQSDIQKKGRKGKKESKEKEEKEEKAE